MQRPLALLVVAIAFVGGCAYPRRSTSLTPAEARTGGVPTPEHVWRLRLQGAIVPPQQRGARDWDEDGGLPDPFVKIYRADELVYESSPVQNSREPDFDVVLPRNVWLPRARELRIELWDEDGLSDDPIGIWRGQGLPPNALPNADAEISFDSGASLRIRVLPPEPHRGVGVAEYEVRSDAFRVVEVLPQSPAGRAGLERGDEIVAIGGQRIEELGSARAASALSLAATRGETLTVRRDGQRVELELDRGYVWLTM